MFRFEHPDFLFFGLLVPALVLLFFVARVLRRRAIRRFGNSRLVGKMAPLRSNLKQGVKFGLFIGGLLFLVIGLSNPQWGTRREKVKRKSADILIALDISNSMLAEDIAPNRLERAKRFSQDLIQQLQGERLGFIIFAGNAFLQVPITTDYSALALSVKSAAPSMIPIQGTALGDVIDLAEQSFEENNKNHKALIIISDGENHEEEALEMAKQANSNGLLIFTVGVGTTGGSFIPTYVTGRRDYKRDETGNPVRSSLNENMLKDISKEGDGAYFNLSSGTEPVLGALQTGIDQLEKRELEQRVFQEYESYFQYFIGVALLLFLLEFVISYRKNKFIEERDLFKT